MAYLVKCRFCGYPRRVEGEPPGMPHVRAQVFRCRACWVPMVAVPPPPGAFVGEAYEADPGVRATN